MAGGRSHYPGVSEDQSCRLHEPVQVIRWGCSSRALLDHRLTDAPDASRDRRSAAQACLNDDAGKTFGVAGEKQSVRRCVHFRRVVHRPEEMHLSRWQSAGKARKARSFRSVPRDEEDHVIESAHDLKGSIDALFRGQGTDTRQYVDILGQAESAPGLTSGCRSRRRKAPGVNAVRQDRDLGCRNAEVLDQRLGRARPENADRGGSAKQGCCS